MNEETKKRMEELAREILQATAIAKFVNEAPRDQHGNVVVNVAGINGLGMFYIFIN
jgi:hypothetical protein